MAQEQYFYKNSYVLSQKNTNNYITLLLAIKYEVCSSEIYLSIVYSNNNMVIQIHHIKLKYTTFTSCSK